MLSDLSPSLNGWLVVGIMLGSGFVLGSIFDRLLRLVGVRDRHEGR